MSKHDTTDASIPAFEWLSFAGARLITGAIVVLLAFILMIGFTIYWITRSSALGNASNTAAKVDSTRIGQANEGKLVFFTGNLVGAKLEDDLGVEQDNAIRLSRSTSMYQWTESTKSETTKTKTSEDATESPGHGKKDAQGKTTHTESQSEQSTKVYVYSTQWNDDMIASSGFHNPENHENPERKRIDNQTVTAPNPAVGAFVLSDDLVQQIDQSNPVTITEDMRPMLKPEVRNTAAIDDGAIYMSTNPEVKPNPFSPEVGDIKIKYEVTPGGPVSVLAAQNGNHATSFSAPNGQSIAVVHLGIESMSQMVGKEKEELLLVTAIILVTAGLGAFLGTWAALPPLVRWRHRSKLISMLGANGSWLGVFMDTAGVCLLGIVVPLALSGSRVGIVLIIGVALIGSGVVWLRKRRKRHLIPGEN
jgi:Transmembrane protein 43